MSSMQSEIASRLVQFLDLDTDGRRRFVLGVILESGEITVSTLYKAVKEQFETSRKVVASLLGYICSKLGILRAHKKSYRLPTVYILKEEYTDLVRSVLNAAAVPSDS
jgi:predicted transcriptional regulator